MVSKEELSKHISGGNSRRSTEGTLSLKVKSFKLKLLTMSEEDGQRYQRRVTKFLDAFSRLLSIRSDSLCGVDISEDLDDMTLIDLVDLFFNWLAYAEQLNNKDIHAIINDNKSLLETPGVLSDILTNTTKLFGK
jgi:hypothetical protein